jgi:hypothetical protein
MAGRAYGSGAQISTKMSPGCDRGPPPEPIEYSHISF